MERADINTFTAPVETASTFVTITLLSGSADFVALIPADVAAFFAAHGVVTILPIRLPSRSQPFGLITRRSEEHTSELQSLMRISYAVFCLKKKIDAHFTLIIELTDAIQTKT